MPTFPLLALGAALLLALVHIFTPRMRFLAGTPRSVWLSIAGGVSVAYVFVHLIPELGSGQEEFSRALGSVLGIADRHVYLIALVGLVIFYGLQRLGEQSRRKRSAEVGEDRTSPAVFWIHMTSFGIYTALIGYLLLHLERRTVLALAFFAVAMALHFLVTDFGLNEDHKEQYRSWGRWVLVVALFIGLAVGYLTEISDVLIVILVAFLAGGIILNVLKEEIPQERRSRFWAFALGAGVYAALLLTL